MSLPSTYKVVQVPQPNAEFEIVERTMPEVGPNDVLIKVEACGMCHSDMFGKIGAFPGTKYPVVPGHEVVGRIVALGSNVKKFTVGERVGRGWHGGHCFQCNNCSCGDFVTCVTHQITGLNSEGGYGEYMKASFESFAKVPESLPAADAAPLLCAGVTVFNSLRNMNIKPGQLVAVHGIGGLGHLGIQFARKMGFKVAAISTSDSKRELASELGAHIYIDTSKEDAAKVLQSHGGAKCILTTVFDSKAMSKLIDGLSTSGTLLVVGADVQSLDVTPLQLIGARRCIQGWPSGSAQDSQETLEFAALHGIKSYSEVYPATKVTEAYNQMMSNKARFRVVLVPEF